ncbi:MAG: hypothetical protein FWC84_04190, partial [Alphaproteobacteria bacterium]|nr:hypothetical protein [Alphaproteobacteria bacterium]
KAGENGASQNPNDSGRQSPIPRDKSYKAESIKAKSQWKALGGIIRQMKTPSCPYGKAIGVC